jgi:hypothetical protein
MHLPDPRVYLRDAAAPPPRRPATPPPRRLATPLACPPARLPAYPPAAYPPAAYPLPFPDTGPPLQPLQTEGGNCRAPSASVAVYRLRRLRQAAPGEEAAEA